jgi:hypothetical protein
MIDSLGMDLPVEEQISLQKQYNSDIFIANDKFRDPKTTTALTIDYLKELIKQDVFDKEIIVIIQGENVNDYIEHFNELLIITTNSEQCINCDYAPSCIFIFQQNKTIKSLEYCKEFYEKANIERKWLFRFGIGGLIRRKIEEQESIIKGILSYAIKSSAFTFKDIYPKRTRKIMTDTKKGFVSVIEYDPIQFHIFGIGVSEQIFPTLVKNQPFIMSFDSRTPSQIAIIPKFLDKNLKHFPTQKEVLKYIPYENLTFREQEDDVGDISALNTLRGFYNIAMILYAIESKMKLLNENKEINVIKRFLKYPSPKSTKIKTLEEFFEEKVSRILALSYDEKKKRGMTDEEIIEDALKRWTEDYERTGIMTTSLAILNGLVIFKKLSIKEIVANIPFIKSPSAAMNVITIGYKIMSYPICEDTPEYKQGLVRKTIKIRGEFLNLVLKYLLKDSSLIESYKEIRESWFVKTSKDDVKKIIEYLQNKDRANIQEIQWNAKINGSRISGYIRCLAVLNILNIDQGSLSIFCSLNRNSTILKSINYKKSHIINWKMVKDRLIMFLLFLLSVIIGNLILSLIF